jgi:Rod binding domain-containing protein
MTVGQLDLAQANVTALAPKLDAKAMRDVEKSAREFEAVFISQMFEQMWAGIKTDGPMGGGTGEQIFRSLMIQDIGRQMASQGGIGLADTVKRELLAIQERSAK